MSSVQHTTTLDTIDCGTAIARRAWPLDKHGIVVQPDMKIEDVYECLYLWMPKNAIARSAASFDTFDRSQMFNCQMETCLQLFIRGVQRTVIVLHDTTSAALKQSDFPFYMFLEVILSRKHDDPLYVQDEADEETRMVRADVAEFERMLYGTDRMAIDVKAGVMFGSASTDHIEFLRGYDQNRDVLGYKIWVMSREPNVSMAANMHIIFAEAKKTYERSFGADGDGNGASPLAAINARRAGAKIAADGSVNFADTVKDCELYRLLISNLHYIDMVRIYTGEERLESRDILNKCLSATTPMSHPSNIVHPRHVFDAKKQMRKMAGNTRIEPRQTRLSNYFDPRKSTWRFPIPNCVIIVPIELWSVQRFRSMYTPDHQRLVVEPRLDRGAGFAKQRQRRVLRSQTDDNDSVEIGREINLPAAPAVPISRAAAAVVDETTRTYVPVDEKELFADEVAPPTPVHADDNSSPNVGNGEAEASSSDDSIVLESSGRYVSERARAGHMPILFDDPAASDDGGGGAVGVDEDFNDEDDNDNGGDDDDSDSGDCVHNLSANGGGAGLFDRSQSSFNTLIAGDFVCADKTALMQPSSILSAANKNQLHTMRSHYFRTQLPNIDNIRDPQLKARIYLMMQHNCCEEYYVKCMSSSSNISKPGRAIGAWMQTVTSEHHPIGPRFYHDKHAYIDRELSLYGTMNVRQMHQLESVATVYTCHAELQMCMRAAMSAYHYGFNMLRPHLMMYGPPATSKSYPITVLSELMIQGTVEAFTSQSQQADAHDSDDSDIVFAFEEMPRKLIDNAGANADAQDTLKEVITRGICTRRRAVLSEDGTQKVHTSVSEKHVVYLCATNLALNQFDSAIASRFIMRHHVEKARTDMDMQQKQDQSRRNARLQLPKLAREHFEHNFRMTQALHYHIEKGITIGMLIEPTAIVFSTIFPIYTRYLKTRFAIRIERRIGEQLIGFMRSEIINYAIYWFYYSPASPFYGKQFHPYHLPLFNIFLKDSEEMAHYALDQFKESFINVEQKAVVHALRTNFAQMLWHDNQHINIFNPNIKTSTRDADDLGDEPADDYAAGQFAQDFQKRRAPGAETAVPLGAMAHKPAQLEIDYNYLPIHMTLRKFARKIANAMQNSNAVRKLDQNDVHLILKHLQRSRIISHPYVRATALGGSVPVVPNTLEAEIPFVALRVAADGGLIFLHSSLAFGGDVDEHELALRACMTSFTPTAKFISGLPADEGRPHLINVRMVGPQPHTPLVEPLPTSSAAVSFAIGSVSTERGLPADERSAYEKITHDSAVKSAIGIVEEEPNVAAQLAGTDVPRVALMCSLDEYATAYRLGQISAPVTRSNVAMFTMSNMDDYARSLRGAMVPRPIVYPDDALRESDQARARHDSNKATTMFGKGDYEELMQNDPELAKEVPVHDDNALEPEVGPLSETARQLLQIGRRKRGIAEAAECNQVGNARRRELEKRARLEADNAATVVALTADLAPAAPAAPAVALPQRRAASAAAETEQHIDEVSLPAMTNAVVLKAAPVNRHPVMPLFFEHTQEPMYLQNAESAGSSTSGGMPFFPPSMQSVAIAKPVSALTAGRRRRMGGAQSDKRSDLTR